MPVRNACRADLPLMAGVFAAAFGSDRLFSIKFPYREKYPQDYAQALEEHLWLSWYDYQTILQVSYLDVPSSPARGLQHRSNEETPPHSVANLKSEVIAPRDEVVITGFAEWKREGTGWESVYGIRSRWDPRLWVRPLLAMFYHIRRTFFRENRAAARSTAELGADQPLLTPWNFMRIIEPFTAEFFRAPHRRNHWALEFLAVHPAYQGHGWGRELVQVGMSMTAYRSGGSRVRDDKDGLPLSVIAAEGKEGFYQKCGFNELVGWVSESKGTGARQQNPLKAHGIGGCAVLWTR